MAWAVSDRRAGRRRTEPLDGERIKRSSAMIWHGGPWTRPSLGPCSLPPSSGPATVNPGPPLGSIVHSVHTVTVWGRAWGPQPPLSCPPLSRNNVMGTPGLPRLLPGVMSILTVLTLTATPSPRVPRLWIKEDSGRERRHSPPRTSLPRQSLCKRTHHAELFRIHLGRTSGCRRKRKMGSRQGEFVVLW